MSADILQLASIEEPEHEAPKEEALERSESFLAKVLHNKKKDAAIITLVVSASLVWTIWVVLNFQTNIEYKQSLLQQQYYFENEINNLQNKIDVLSARQTEKKAFYANSRVFSGYQEIAEWLYELAERSRRNNLLVEYQLNDVIKDERLENIYIIPLELEILAIREHSMQGVYNQFLDYMDNFLQQPIYLNLVGAEIENVNAKTGKLAIKVHIKMWSDNLSEIQQEASAEQNLISYTSRP